MTVDQRSFRKALGCFASGVSVATTLNPATRKPVGVTVSAFSSVSLSPPLVLFCLAKTTQSLESYKNFGYFAINILAENQRDLSIRFASRGEDKYQGITWDTWESGVPILPGCLTVLECRLVQTHDGGDHIIFVGEVERLKSREGGLPLLYFRGSYMDCGTGGIA